MSATCTTRRGRTGLTPVALLTTLAVLALLGRPRTTAAEPAEAISVPTPQEVKALGPDKIKPVIKRALEYRLSQCRNIYYDQETRYGLCRFGEKVPGDFTQPFTNERVQCWAIGDSFRVDKERRTLGGKTEYVRCDAFDSKTGLGRYYGMDQPSGDNKYGAIDTKLSQAPFKHILIYWLGMPDQSQYACEFFIRKMVENYANWRTRILDDGSVELECDWKLALNKEVVGKAIYTLDPVKGFLPTTGYGLWKDPTPAAAFHQYEFRFVVEESKEVKAGLWMPMKMRDSICPNADPDKGNLYLTTVKTIAIGDTKDSQLQLTFPEGTLVQDLTKGVVLPGGPSARPKR